MTATAIADFLIFDKRLPRSLAFCVKQTTENLRYLEEEYDTRHPCHDMAEKLRRQLRSRTIGEVFEEGLHEYISNFIRQNNALGSQIEQDYRFIG